MSTDNILEIVEFAAKEGCAVENVVQGLKILDKFYQGFDGYRGIKIAKSEQDTWLLTLDWESAQAEKEASVAMMKSPDTELFKNIVNPKTVSKRLLARVLLD